MEQFLFKIYDVPISTLLAFLEATAVHPHEEQAQLATYAGYSVSTARKAIPSLLSLKLIMQGEDGKYVCTANSIRRGVDEETAKLVFRQALQSYRPFEAVCEGLALGESSNEAIRKSGVLLTIEANDISKFDILIKWGLAVGILQETDEGQIVLARELIIDSERDLGVINANDLESEAKARFYNSRQLGRKVTNFLDETDRKLLADALLSYMSAPRDSVEKSGQALENFLRELAQNQGFVKEAKKSNGAGQLANMLVQKAIIHSHQQKLVDAVSTVRNATAHHKDKKTLIPWTITEFAAFGTFTTTLVAIRSIYNFVYERRQTV